MFWKSFLFVSVVLKDSYETNIEVCIKTITSLLSDFNQNIIYAFREKEKTVTSSASPVMLPRLDDARKIGNSQNFGRPWLECYKASK